MKVFSYEFYVMRKMEWTLNLDVCSRSLRGVNDGSYESDLSERWHLSRLPCQPLAAT
ncbi:hypothetical protein CODIS_14480 [Candidatus Thiodiazotropha endolucinida]|uniref:Uncharacterized protein n=1 Tax=Candidatus Thiodiazotropha endolucinida TaxID=1655433 RepID=A0A7Z0VNI1_9GAMM|nr:hypothetical protein CODIS_14480 [Candidatus Thiodiazotropha endolucinida]